MALTIQTVVGGMELIGNVNFVVDASQECSVTLKSGTEVLNIVTKFRNDATGFRIQSNVINDSTLELIYYNYINQLGSFNTDYWRLGTISNRHLYMTYFIVHLNGTNMKRVEYIFYLGEGVING